MTRTLPSLLCLAALALPSRTQEPGGAGAQEPGGGARERTETRLLISKIVLYKHGIGYFERKGMVDGSATIPLTFKSAQMKDVLKSLFAVDLGGGQISTVHYDSKDPVARQLDEILFKVPEANALTQFLMQLKGARVRVNVGTQVVVGNILGIEPIQKRTDAGIATSYKLVLLRADGAIQPLELLDATDVTVLDENLRADLARMMEIYAKSRHADRKVVEVRAEGEGQRQIRAGYIIETPIWKTSYRLLFDEGVAPLLQGWAIVENRTDEDWRDVQLSFVAGSPISFVMDLYTSYYPVRPVVQVGVAAAERGAVARSEDQFLGRLGDDEKAKKGERRARAAAPPAAEAMDAAPEPSLGELISQSVGTVTQGVEVGDLFAYAAKTPVSIKQGRAALVPILLERLDTSRRVLHWRADVSKHPSHAALVANSTALTLEKGPVTVFHGSTYLGEGLFEQTLKTGMRDIVPYALEPGVQVEAQSKSAPQAYTRGSLANGMLTLFRRELWETRYTIRNKTAKAHPFYLDHPKAGADFALVEPARPDEVLPAHYRFVLELAASAEAPLVVREDREVSQTVSITTQSPEQLRWFASQGFVSEKTKLFLAGLAVILEERAALDGRIRQATEERNRAVSDQGRIRENLNVLRDSPKEKTLRDQLLERLVRSTETLDELDRRIADDTRRRQEIDQRIAREIQAFRE